MHLELNRELRAFNLINTQQQPIHLVRKLNAIHYHNALPENKSLLMYIFFILAINNVYTSSIKI